MDRRDFIEKSALAASGALLSATGVEALANDKNGKTMKVLMINGSPHQKGNTAVALDEIAKQLKVNGIDSEIVWIGNKAVRGCIACGGCSRNPGKCVFDDDICNRISEKFAEAERCRAQRHPASLLLQWGEHFRQAGGRGRGMPPGRRHRLF